MRNKLTLAEWAIVSLLFIDVAFIVFLALWISTRFAVAPHDVQATVLEETAEIDVTLDRIEARLNQ